MDRFCRTCGTPLRAGDRFCGSCGSQVRGDDASAADDAGRERFRAVFGDRDMTGAATVSETDDPARQRFRRTFEHVGSESLSVGAVGTSTRTSGGAVSLSIAVVTIIAAVVLAPIGLIVLVLGGVLAMAVGLSFTGGGSAERTSDQQLAVVGAIVGAGEAVIGLLAAIA